MWGVAIRAPRFFFKALNIIETLAVIETSDVFGALYVVRRLRVIGTVYTFHGSVALDVVDAKRYQDSCRRALLDCRRTLCLLVLAPGVSSKRGNYPGFSFALR